MSLKIYHKDSGGSWVETTQDDDLTNPIHTIHDGKNGDTKVVSLAIHNDGSTSLWYSDVAVVAEDLVDSGSMDDTIYEETGWGIKLSSEASEPTEAEWDDIDWGNQIDIVDIGSDSGADLSYFPFWCLITCPPNTDAQNKQDLVIKTLYTENAVT